MEIRKNQEIELTVVDVNNRGYGVGRLGDEASGKVVFVADAVMGERVRVKIIKVASDYLVGRVEERLSPSAHRIESDCAVFDRCGGCVYRHLRYEKEGELKQRYVENAFRKAGLSVTVAPIALGKESGYRNKVECPLTAAYEAGFFSARSHTVVPSAACRLQDARLTPVMASVCEWLKEQAVSLYDENTGKGLLRHVYLRCGTVSGEIMLTLVINGKSLPHAKELAAYIMKKHPDVVSVFLNHNEKRDNVILGDKTTLVAGKDHIEDSLCGLRFRLAPLSFYQVNGQMAERLYQKALELAALKAEDVLVDLFCGVGTIGLFMLKNVNLKKLVGVEIVPEAVEKAKENAALNGLQATFLCGDANATALEEADVIVVDPPRKGCGEALLHRIAAIGPRRLVYISCNPDTLARDVAILSQLGYTADTVYPFDLFPRTGHVETIVCLNKQ